MKNRHKWGAVREKKYTVLQECEKCGLFRFKALGVWVYSKEETDSMLVNAVPNNGCNGEK